MFTLHNGDCLTVLPSIPSGSIDAIITDLPFGTTACKWDSIIPLLPMWKEVKRVLKSTGTFITTASQPFTSALIASNYEMFKYEYIWNKSRRFGVLHAKNMPLKKHENVEVFSKGIVAHIGKSKNRMTYNPQMQEGKPYKKLVTRKQFEGTEHRLARPSLNEKMIINDGYRYPHTVLDFPFGNNKSLHPTQKPVALYEYLIKTYTNEGEMVLDIAMGSGTTIEAAERTGRNSIGIEKDEGIFQSAVLRLKSYTPSNKACTRQGQVAPQFDNFE